MTTVVYDGHKIASDSSCVGDFLHQGKTQKIFHFPDTGHYFAIAGAYISARYYIGWINAGMVPEDEPVIPEGCAFSILWIREGKTPLVSDNGFAMFMPIEPPFAIGSGSHLALAALTAGSSIEDSIAIASLFDPYTDNRVVSMEVKPFEPPAVKKIKKKKKKKKESV